MRTLLLLAVLLTMSSAVQGKRPHFGVRLEFGCAAPDILDTFKGTYERVMSGRRQGQSIGDLGPASTW